MRKRHTFRVFAGMLDSLLKDKEKIMILCGDVYVETTEKSLKIAIAGGNIEGVSGSLDDDMPKTIWIHPLEHNINIYI